MAQYRHLPVWQAVLDLALHLERAVWRFSFPVAVSNKIRQSTTAFSHWNFFTHNIFFDKRRQYMNTNTRTITLAAQALLLFALAQPMAAQAALFENDDGTVTDTVTNLIWDQCSQGQSGVACATGSATIMIWAAALTAAVTANTANYKGYSDWRVPSKNELESLVDITKATNPVIDLVAFPATPTSSFYWSSTTYTLDPSMAWDVYFGTGSSFADVKTVSGQVRLVRSGL